MRGGGTSDLLRGGSGIGIRARSAIFHAIFETFDGTSQVTTQAFELFGAKHQNNNQ